MNIWKFYVALLDVPNIDASIWDITLRGVSLQFLVDLLVALVEMERPMVAFPTVLDMPNKLDVEDVFHTF